MLSSTTLFNLCNMTTFSVGELISVIRSQPDSVSIAEGESWQKLKTLLKTSLELLLLELDTPAKPTDGEKDCEFLKSISHLVEDKINNTHNKLFDKPKLSDREKEILYYASIGKTYSETALILGITISTIKFHMSNVVKKLDVSNSRQAIRLGVELSLCDKI